MAPSPRKLDGSGRSQTRGCGPPFPEGEGWGEGERGSGCLDGFGVLGHASIEARISVCSPCGISAAHPSTVQACASAFGSVTTPHRRSRPVSFFMPRSTRRPARRSGMRRVRATQGKSWLSSPRNSTAFRCATGNRSSAASSSGAARVHKGASAGGSVRRRRPHQRHQPARRGFLATLRQASAVTVNNQTASTVCFRSLRARRASTRKTARVTSPALSVLPVRRYAEE